VTDVTENRRWNAYACPACRLVFKFPDTSEEPNACCPACHQVLQIPDHHNPSDPPHGDVSPPSDKPERVRKRRKRNRAKDSLSWETENSSKLVRKGRRKKKLSIFTILGILVTLVLFAWLFRMELQTRIIQNERSAQAPPVATENPAPITQTQEVPAEPDKALIQITPQFISEAEELAAKFLSAQSVEELRNLVRNPDITIPRIMKLHPDGRIDMGGLATFNTNDQFMRSGEFTSVLVRTKNYDERTMVFAETTDGIRIDWESWVGWCEMAWDEFMTSKPTTGTLFRVKLGKTNYYNFDFSDDKKWKSYTLLSNDEEHQIYGYVELGSQAAKEINNAFGPGDLYFTLSLKFPENAKSDNQVVIERVISNGWIAPTTPPP
jgi:hypothetical protein